MPSLRHFGFVMLLLGALGAALAAAGEPASPPAMDASSCDQLAQLPNAPMSVSSCKALMGLDANAPASHRPGDDAMSCAQIFAELRTMQGEGVSDATAAHNDALIAEGRALSARHAAEIARQATPSPLAIASSLLPNAVGAALMAPEQARTALAMQRLKAADQRYSTSLGEQMDANAAEVGELVAANPRLPRLSKLAMHKQCTPPQE